MLRPTQPQFKIRVFNGKRIHLDTLKGAAIDTSSDATYIDIEGCVAYPVTYEEEASLLNRLTFTIDKYADVLLYYFYIGQSILLYGGHYSDNSSGMRHVFSGIVSRIRTSFSDSGKVSISVECMNYGFTKLGKDYKHFVYPDSNGRNFARKDSLSLEDVIRGIAEDNKFNIGTIKLSAEARKYRLTNDNIRYQKNISDWKFLTMLAQDFGCTVWISTADGEEQLNFVSNEDAFRMQDTDISFLYPLINSDRTQLSPKESEMQVFHDTAYNRPRILRNVTVDEDISNAYAVSRTAVYFDKDTGEYKESISQITEDKDGKRQITFYELDEQRVEHIHRTRPDIADKIRDGSPTSLPWGTPDDPNNASYYYRVVQIYDESQAVFDRHFFGITVGAKCNQDLNVRSQRTYKIRGILSYHSKDLETSFFLRGLRHIWDADGTWTELDFIR